MEGELGEGDVSSGQPSSLMPCVPHASLCACACVRCVCIKDICSNSVRSMHNANNDNDNSSRLPVSQSINQSGLAVGVRDCDIPKLGPGGQVTGNGRALATRRVVLC